MKILQVNKFYYPRGGADKYFLDLSSALKKEGHKVAVFAMHHPQNLKTPWNKYFISNISFNKPSIENKLKAPARVLYSLEAKRKFKALINDFKPDIIHIHNIYHQLSPSILDVAKQENIPVVMHLHDYKLICPNHTLFTNNQYCERCRSHKYYQCLTHRCVKNSLAASALAMTEMYLHHSILKIYQKNIQLFIAPSQFMKNIVERFSWNKEKIKVVYNSYSNSFLQKNNLINSEEKIKEEEYLLYFGRLSPEKGLNTLIESVANTKQITKIVGTGPSKRELIKLTKKLQAPVNFLGFKDQKSLLPLIKKAKAVIIPSIWAENMPLSLLEALSLGKIVIASNIGGLKEVIQNKKNGLLFQTASKQDLIRCLMDLKTKDYNYLKLAARKTAAKFSPQQNTDKIIAIYQKILKHKK